jgi:hypothetical protein
LPLRINQQVKEKMQESCKVWQLFKRPYEEFIAAQMTDSDGFIPALEPPYQGAANAERQPTAAN